MDMLALTDSALAHLAIAATAIDPRHRQRWLRDIAAKLDPPRIPADLRGGDRDSCDADGANRAVRSLLVVVSTPSLAFSSCIVEAHEPMRVQTFRSEFAVE
jgi:hypothetical protein